jgi:hypothetical protein
MSVTIRKATAAEHGKTFVRSRCYMIEHGGKVVGIIRKDRNTKTDVHPWKVFAVGPFGGLLATFYDDADAAKIGPAFDYETCKIGGRVAAEVFARRYFTGE